MSVLCFPPDPYQAYYRRVSRFMVLILFFPHVSDSCFTWFILFAIRLTICLLLTTFVLHDLELSACLSLIKCGNCTCIRLSLSIVKNTLPSPWMQQEGERGATVGRPYQRLTLCTFPSGTGSSLNGFFLQCQFYFKSLLNPKPKAMLWLGFMLSWFIAPACQWEELLITIGSFGLGSVAELVFLMRVIFGNADLQVDLEKNLCGGQPDGQTHKAIHNVL